MSAQLHGSARFSKVLLWPSLLRLIVEGKTHETSRGVDGHLRSESGARLNDQGWRQVCIERVSTSEVQWGLPGDKRSKLSLQVARVVAIY